MSRERSTRTRFVARGVIGWVMFYHLIMIGVMPPSNRVADCEDPAAPKVTPR